MYGLALEVARWVRSAAFPHGESTLRDQAKRAADSVVLNLADGAYRLGKERAKHYRIARGSAAEICAVLDLVDLEGGRAGTAAAAAAGRRDELQAEVSFRGGRGCRGGPSIPAAPRADLISPAPGANSAGCG